jgi:hypothetical protein
LPKTLDTLAAQALTKNLEKGATGRIYVTTSAGAAGSGSVEVSIHVQQGAILAAEGSDDSHHFVRRLRVAEAISSARTMDLLSKVVKKKSIFGELIDGSLPSEVLDPILMDRFRDNLARFLGSDARPKFELTAGIFVDNLQMGLDTAAMIAEAAGIWEASATVPLDLDLAAGPTPPSDKLEKSLVDSLRQARVVTPLLARLPVEPIAGRAFIGALLSRRVLRLAAEPINDTDLKGINKSISPDEELTDQSLEEDVEDQATAGPPVRRLASDVDELDDDVEVSSDLEEEAEAEPEVIDDAPSAPPLEDEQTAETETEVADDPSSNGHGGQPDLSLLQSWKKGTEEVEDDLDAFADYEQNRGAATGATAKGGPKGGFSTQQRDLDRVEVSDDLAARRDSEPPAEEEPPQDDDTPIAIDEAPQAKFAAPTLTEEEAVEKIAIANEVLAVILSALDAHEGAGGGRAALQLMFEGAPARFQPMFEGVEVGEDEDLIDAEAIIGNLATRPPTEHRQMLKDGLIDLIDRALSHGADELSDEAIDAMLEATAGYRARFGL